MKQLNSKTLAIMAKIYFGLSFILFSVASFAQQFSAEKIPGKRAETNVSINKAFVNNGNQNETSFKSNDVCGEKYIQFSKFDTVPMPGWKRISKSTNNVGNKKPEWQLRKFNSGPSALGCPTTTVDGVSEQVEVNEWLISPDIELPAGKKYRFVFTWSTSSYWNAKGDPDGKNDLTDYEIKISVGGGATDTSVYDPAFFREDDEAKVVAGGIAWPYQSWEYYTSSYDLSAYAGKKINIALHAVSRPQGAVEFIIPDMYFEEWPPNDLTIKKNRVYSGKEELGYTFIPLHQMTPISFDARVKNNGILAQPNTRLQAEIKDASGSIFKKESLGILLDVNKDSLLVVNDKNNFDPIAAGVDTTKILTVYEQFISDSTECIPGDNLRSLPLYFNDSIYARDLFGFQGPGSSLVNWAGASGQSFRIGNLYEIFMSKNIPFVDVGIDTDTKFKEQAIFAQVHKYNYDKEEFELLEQTEDYNLAEGDIGKVVSLKFETPLKVEKEDLLLVVAGHYGGPADGSEDVAFMTSGDGIQGEILGFAADNTLYSLTSPPIPVVRLNFGAPDVSVPNLDYLDVTLQDMYPNPAREIGFIKYSVNNSSNIKFRISETNGKIVKEWNEGRKSNGSYTTKVDLQYLNSGIYFYSLVTDKGTVTKRFSLVK